MAKLDKRLGVLMKQIKEFIRGCKENKMSSAELTRANRTIETASVNQFLKHYQLTAEERVKLADIRNVSKFEKISLKQRMYLNCPISGQVP